MKKRLEVGERKRRRIWSFVMAYRLKNFHNIVVFAALKRKLGKVGGIL